ncbi:MAG: serine hydrolase [Pseudomonadota bacterium]
MSFSSLYRSFAGAILFALLPLNLFAAERSQIPFLVDEERVTDRIDRIMIEYGVPSISVASVSGDGEIWAYASGIANKKKKKQATPETVYRLASVSKPITAIAVMLFVDRGLIDLDAPANDYLGEQKIVATAGNAEDVTVRRLMAHRAGLPLHYNLIHDNEDYERRSLDETIARYGIAMLPPGLTQRYSNIGYGVLERIIEVQSGKSYTDFLHEAFFQPLGMTSAGVFEGPSQPKGIALPYTRSGDLYPAYDIDTRGAGGVYMTASDLVRFGRFFSDALDGRSELLSAENAHEMLKIQDSSQEGKLEWYVLGWVHELRGKDRQYDTIYHLGSTPGTRAELWIYPEKDLVVATLLNEMSYDPLDEAREAVLEALIPERTFRPYRKSKPYFSFDVPEAFRKAWVGTISLGADGALSVEADLRDPEGPKVLIDGKSVVVRSASENDGLVTITTDGIDLPTEDTARQPYELGFMLAADPDKLKGYVSANRLADRTRDSGNYAFDVMMVPSNISE